MNRIWIILPCSCNLSPSSNNPEMQLCVLTTLRISSLAAAHIFNCLASFNIIFWRIVTSVGCDLSIIDWALLTMDNIDWKIVEIIKPVMTWTTSASETPSPEQLQTNTRYETEPKEFWENLQYYKVKWFFLVFINVCLCLHTTQIWWVANICSPEPFNRWNLCNFFGSTLMWRFCCG